LFRPEKCLHWNFALTSLEVDALNGYR